MTLESERLVVWLSWHQRYQGNHIVNIKHLLTTQYYAFPATQHTESFLSRRILFLPSVRSVLCSVKKYHHQISAHNNLREPTVSCSLWLRI